MPKRFLALDPEQLRVATEAFRFVVEELSKLPLTVDAATLDEIAANSVLTGLAEGRMDSRALGAWCVDQVRQGLRTEPDS